MTHNIIDQKIAFSEQLSTMRATVTSYNSHNTLLRYYYAAITAILFMASSTMPTAVGGGGAGNTNGMDDATIIKTTDAATSSSSTLPEDIILVNDSPLDKKSLPPQSIDDTVEIDSEDSSDDDDDEDDDDDYDYDDDYDPMGLQEWSNETSFLRALRGGRLVLVIMLAPWCDRGAGEMTLAASQASEWLDEIFLLSSGGGGDDDHRRDDDVDVDNVDENSKEERHFPGYNEWIYPLFSYGMNSTTSTTESMSSSSLGLADPPSPLPKPLIGTIDSTSLPPGLLDSLGPVSAYPALKFVLTFPKGEEHNDEDEDDNEDEVDDDGEILIWDYIGPRETAKDLYDSVLMYWYRFVVSNAIDRYYLPLDSEETETLESDASGSATSTNENVDDIGHENGAENEDGEERPPVFSFPSHHHMIKFLQQHGDRLLRPAQARHYQIGKNTLEAELFDLYMGGANEDDLSGVFHPYEFLDGNDDDLYNTMNENCENCRQTHEMVQEIDPYIILVQCRLATDLRDVQSECESEIEDEDKTSHAQSVLNAKFEFDEIAEEMSHRKDVAFFTLDASSMYDEEITNPSCLEQETANIINNTPTICDNTPQWFRGMESDDDGAVSVLRVRRYVTYSFAAPEKDHRNSKNPLWNQQQRRVIEKVTTDWNDISVEKNVSWAVFVPASTPTTIEEEETDIIHGKDIKKQYVDAKEHVKSHLVPFTVAHSTPTVLWLDRHRVAQLAFPWYRPTHAVLFVDMALAHQMLHPSYSYSEPGHPPWPSSLNRSSETAQLLLDQKKAISQFYGAALRHRAERPLEDVVFLIVPSTEVRVMTAFGVDIWTPLDEAMFNTVHDESHLDSEAGIDRDGDEGAFVQGDELGIGYCSSTARILPVMMITDSSSRSGKQSSRHYLCSHDIFTTSSVAPEHGGAMSTFIENFFSNSLGKPFIRSEDGHISQTSKANQPAAKAANVTNESGVHILTGNTFESMVMDRNDAHTMLLMQTTTCGHCKRFSIFWNEFSRLVQALNWGNVINVMKIDVSKNDVPHKEVDAWDLPSVYYFPAGEKENPIEMTYGSTMNEESKSQHVYDEGLSWVNSGYDLVEWMVKQGKLDLDLLLKLDELVNAKEESDTIDLD